MYTKGIKENTHKKLLIATHMDETGMMIDEISKDGYLYFTPLGKIDPRVLCGKNVIVGKCDDENGKGRIHGIISSKAIHHQSPEERKKVTPIDKMYIDIGESDHDGACKFVSVGDFTVFDNSYISYGSEAAKLVNSSALDARMPCTALIDAARRLNNSHNDLKCDIYFVFGTRGALGAYNQSGTKREPAVADQRKHRRAFRRCRTGTVKRLRLKVRVFVHAGQISSHSIRNRKPCGS